MNNFNRAALYSMIVPGVLLILVVTTIIEAALLIAGVI
jgi:hypothetical protein